MILPAYSLGLGDRFGRQGRAQLMAVALARRRGVEVAPVWNKSHREHQITGTRSESVRAEADAAVAAVGWPGPYFVDADHITLATVEDFVATCDFFTIDVADFVGRPVPEADVQGFVARHRRFAGRDAGAAIGGTLAASADAIGAVARRFLAAAREAAAIFHRIEAARGRDNCVIEVSLDETEEPQTPAELFFILAALADAGIPVQTIAPKFTGRFNKGIDYVGSIEQFEQQFSRNLEVVALAVHEFGLPPNLKLSVHSGSDKFSLYGPITRALRRHGAGVHLKTAGTTWLAEVAGLAQAGAETLRIVQDIYAQAYARLDELCTPYAAVIDIDRTHLPAPSTVRAWSGAEFVGALLHNQASPAYNPHVRQLLHVGYKIAAEMGESYLQALDATAELIGPLVTENLLEKHILPVFGAAGA